jgi:hypothetical protein
VDRPHKGLQEQLGMGERQLWQICPYVDNDEAPEPENDEPAA